MIGNESRNLICDTSTCSKISISMALQRATYTTIPKIRRQLVALTYNVHINRLITYKKRYVYLLNKKVTII